MSLQNPASPRRRLLMLALVAGLAGVGAEATAQGVDDSNGRTPERARREDHRALSESVRRVERATGGEVLSAERVPFDGRDVNRVKVVDASGRVRVYMDDPQPRRERDESRRTRRNDGNND